MPTESILVYLTGGYAIKGFCINNKVGNTGLVGFLGETGVIKNLTITGHIQSNGSTLSNVGAFVGQCKGKIMNCVNHAEITTSAGTVGGIAGSSNKAAEMTTSIKNCMNTGKITAEGGAVGGIIGSLLANTGIENCVNAGDINSPSSTSQSGIAGVVGNVSDKSSYVFNCVNTGTIYASTTWKWGGASNVGGIAGSLSGKVTDCVSTGNVIAIPNPDAPDKTGKYVGGIVGELKGTVANCFWLKDAAVSPDHGIGGAGNYTVGTDEGTSSADMAEKLPAAAILLDTYVKVGHTFALTATAYPTASAAASDLVVTGAEGLKLSPSDIKNSLANIMTVVAGTVGATYDAAVSLKDMTTIAASADFTVTRSAITVESISLSQKTLTVNVGDAAQLKAIVLPETATNPNVSWASDNVAVATVDKDGNVKAVAYGTAIITATTEDGQKSADCEVTVNRDSSSSGGCSAGVGVLALVPLFYRRER